MRLTSRSVRVLPVLLALILLGSACSTIGGGTAASDLETRNAQLQGTIDSLGTPAATITVLQLTAERSMSLQAEMNNVQSTALAMQSTLTVLQLGGPGGVIATSAPGSVGIPSQSVAGAGGAGVDTSGGLTPAPADSGQTSFYETTTATGRDNMDCPSGATAIFDTSEDAIYVISRISNLQAGSTISARWLANGALVEEGVCWEPSSDWDDVCAYCEITPPTGIFDAGSWRAEVLLDGQLMAQAQFEVVDSSGQQAGTGTGDDLGGDFSENPADTGTGTLE
ncbi:MAG: hypothetical protein GXY36_13075 [Chloroflexi bacterium]|nr:hypothetical protein [Chloroflexota bacterium]